MSGLPFDVLNCIWNYLYDEDLVHAATAELYNRNRDPKQIQKYMRGRILSDYTNASIIQVDDSGVEYNSFDRADPSKPESSSDETGVWIKRLLEMLSSLRVYQIITTIQRSYLENGIPFDPDFLSDYYVGRYNILWPYILEDTSYGFDTILRIVIALIDCGLNPTLIRVSIGNSIRRDTLRNTSARSSSI